ncbi:L,D-transpeptidase [Streptomyces endophytica]|uniref:Ig-like domain-containing protein n=1 Tax=Streptomyces endophytica TaxID=2991496 RepID=A0ABY6P833_9ACTN|nr:Ig-like domain-containing protein [Streptomyces endophytica]UZJ29530.1 Ig-like domain-containing protein [Streptomyces endophytica]
MTAHQQERAGGRAKHHRNVRARVARAVVAWLAGTVALAGCGDTEALIGGAPRTPEEAIRIVPENGARGVRANRRFEVRVPEGRLERVHVTRTAGAGRQPVVGRISPDGMVWRPVAGPLRPGTTYTVDAVALDGAGHRATRRTTFTTAPPVHRVTGSFSPQGDATVGTGLIFSMVFNRPIADRAAVERAVRVSAQPRVEVAAHWFGRRRLDFRPRDRWRPGTRITVELRLRGVKAAPSAYGTQRRTVHYRVGRDQVSFIDAARHTMTVRRDGRTVAVLPVTAGDAENPTYNGRMVILERHSLTRMDGGTVGFGGEYDIPDVPHAMRLTRSGTFLHGNYWARPEVFGGLNTSHGCVGLKDIKGGGPHTPAGWFFAQSIVGDTVIVQNSPERLVAPDNGLGGWNLSWEQWRSGSALH